MHVIKWCYHWLVVTELVSWSLTSLFSTNMAISETELSLRITHKNYYFNTAKQFYLDISVSTRDLHWKSLFSSSSGSCHNRDVTLQEIGHACGSVCSCPHPASRIVVLFPNMCINSTYSERRMTTKPPIQRTFITLSACLFYWPWRQRAGIKGTCCFVYPALTLMVGWQEGHLAH